jgi:hypothetical protein
VDRIKFDLSELVKVPDLLKKKIIDEWLVQACESYALYLEEMVVDEIDRLKLNVSGDMRKSITHDVTRTLINYLIVVGTNLKTASGYPYPLGVHEGTRPHWGPIAPLQTWVRLKLNIQDAKEANQIAHRIQWSIAKKGTKPHPFMKNVFEKEKPYIAQKIGNYLTEAMAGGQFV